MTNRVWVLGDVTVDLTLFCERFPDTGGDSFAERRVAGMGGCGANVSLVLAGLGLRPTLVANVGNDHWGTTYADLLSRAGVDVTELTRDHTDATHLTVIIVTGDGERTVFGHRGASAKASTWPAGSRFSGPGGALIVSGYALLGEHRLLQARRAIRVAAAAGVPVLLDLPADAPASLSRAAHDLLGSVRVLLVGGEDARAVAGASDPESAASALCPPAGCLVLKLGADGCIMFDASGMTRIAGTELRAVDTTGAGDAFLGGFVASWLAGLPSSDVIALANAFGATATQRAGAAAAMPSPTDVITFAGVSSGLSATACAWLEMTAARTG